MIPVPQFVLSLAMSLTGKMVKVNVVAATGSVWSLCLHRHCIMKYWSLVDINRRPMMHPRRSHSVATVLLGLVLFFYFLFSAAAELPGFREYIF